LEFITENSGAAGSFLSKPTHVWALTAIPSSIATITKVNFLNIKTFF